MQTISIQSLSSHNLLNISNQHAHIWLINLSPLYERVNEFKSILNHEEIERANRFHFPIHHDRFVITRAILRKLLAIYLSASSEKIIFSYTDHGKPFLDNNDLTFNTSHTEDYAAFAITRNNRIGIDIEYSKTLREFDELAERFFTQSEAIAIKNFSGEQKQEKFYQLWTAKEAIIKAVGLGLSYELKRFTIDISQAQSVITAWQDQMENIRNWHLKNWVPADNYYLTVAIDNSLPSITLQNLIV